MEAAQPEGAFMPVPMAGECLSLWSHFQRHCLSLLLTAFPCGSS
eukprot:SAG22_NODE_991_length_6129_cov_8.370813_3_plen_44_part_00